MFISDKDEIFIPKEELRYVEPQSRIKLFNHLLDTLKRMVPDLKLMYAYLNWDYDENEEEEIVVNRKIESAYNPKIIYSQNDVNNPDQNPDIDTQRMNALSTELKNMHTMTIKVHDQPCYIDYMLFFKYTTINEYNKQEQEAVFFISPYISTDFSIPGYRYVVRTKQLDSWIDTFIKTMPRVESTKFNEFITNMCGLSLDKGNEKFWKKSENAKILIPFVVELYMRCRIQ